MVILVTKESIEKAESLHQRFGFSLVNDPPEGSYLVFEENRLLVKDRSFSLEVDFSAIYKRLYQQKLSAKKDLLARSLGLDKNKGAAILDGTMGLAKDSFHLAYLGAHIVATERDPVAFALVENAVENSPYIKKVIGQFHCHFCDAETFLKSSEKAFSALYLDPMFSDTDKKSLPKKEMQFLRSRQLENMDYTSLIKLALHRGIERVVVKRPLKGSELYPKPQTSLYGKMIRYDIYRKRTLT